MSRAGGFSRLAGPSYPASSAEIQRSTAASRSPASHRAAPASSSMVPLCPASGASSNVRAASGQRFSSSSASPRQSGWSSWASSSNRPSSSNWRGSSIAPQGVDCARRVQERAAALSRMRQTGAVERLRKITWDALRADVALPAIARVLDGAPAEREVDRALRGSRDLTADARAAVVEAIFGVSLWRRRLAWETGTSGKGEPAILLGSLLRDLAGIPERRALALAGLSAAPANPVPATRLAERWSLPDWLEAHLLLELGDGADAFCAAVAVPGPICLRANRLLCTREQLAARLAVEGIATAPAARAPGALFVTPPRP